MSYKYYPITGIKDGWGPNGAVPVRREFKEWTESKDSKDKTQVIIFLLALKRFQAVPPETRDSYFQIAGIHGMPYTNWDEPNLTLDEAGRKGYCSHANALFPPWHRPYLLLYEQRIHEIMVKEIIPEQPKSRQTEWSEAAKTWRLPHWDWAKNPKVPDLMCWPTVTIRLGDEPPLKIDNPLYSFRMPNDKKMSEYGVGNLKFPDGDEFLEYGECYATNRCPKPEQRDPKSKFWQQGGDNIEIANQHLKQADSITGYDYGTASEMVYRLLTYPLEFSTFGTLARDATMLSNSESSPVNDMNLEFIHNNVHYWVGGDGGHMSQIPVATFDPVFWFHHCNIDRLFAIWQTLNPEKWIDVDSQKPFDQKVIGHGDVVTIKTPLRPFHKDEAGTVWMPEDARDWYKLGYTYPELQTWKDAPGTDSKTKIFAHMNEMYGVNRKQALAMAKNPQSLPGGVEIKDRNPDAKKDEASVAMNDYAVSIAYQKFAMGGQPFNLEVYLRREGQTEETFSAEDYVTNVYNFSQPAEQDGETTCSNCADNQAANVRVTAYIPLTAYLITQIKSKQLDSLDPLTVEPFLKGLYYRVTTASGKPVEKSVWSETMGLKVGVSQTTMTYSSDPEETPKYDDPKLIPSLGTDDTVAPTPAGITASNLPVYKISPLAAPVSAGASIVFRSPSINLAIPRREGARTGISLLSLPPGVDSPEALHDEESYDVLLSMILLPKRRVIQCNTKPAGRGYLQDTEIEPAAWFAGEEAKLRVDMRDSEWVIYVDGKEVGKVERLIKGKDVTHVHYRTMPPTGLPILAKEITGTAYAAGVAVPA